VKRSLDQVIEISQEFSSNSRVKSISLEIEEEDSQRAAHRFINEQRAKRVKKQTPESAKFSIIDSKQDSITSKQQIPKQILSSGNDNLSNFMSFKDGFNSGGQNLNFETNSISSHKFGGNTSSIAQQSFQNPQMISKSKLDFLSYSRY